MKQFYVYGLYDPITNDIFYVGKGKLYRDVSHLKPSMWKNPKNTNNPFLYFKIKSLMENNTPPIIKRIKEDITETEAYDLEYTLIKEHGRRFSKENGKLFNISEYKGGSIQGQQKPWSEERKKQYKILCKNKRIYDPSYEKLYEDYIVLEKTRKLIALENNCSEVLVKKRLEYFGILKPKEKIYPQKNEFICVKCKTTIKVAKSVKNRLYCSRKCMNEAKYGQRRSDTISY